MLRHALFLLAAIAVALPAAAHSHKTKSLEVVHPWTSASAKVKDAKTARIFMTVRSVDGRPDRLVSALAPKGGKVVLDDAGKGSQVFVLGRDKELVLRSDGPSLVLTGLKSPLSAYDDFNMMLVFEHAGRVPIVVMVEE
jgi:copper(I)-binding protein